MGKLTLYATLMLLFATCVADQSTSAQTFTKLLDFRPSKVSGLPYPGGVIRDSAGNLYGTTDGAGGPGLGTVYKVDAHGALTILHTFTKGTNDGAVPYSGLVQDAAGNLYGTTYRGGKFDMGTVFKIDPKGKETVLYSFAGADGSNPSATLILDSAGNLYGTTYQGGYLKACSAFGCGVVFKLSQAGTLTVLHRFVGRDGKQPVAALFMDSSGNLYGTTASGGDTASCCGVVFKLSQEGKVTVLHRFVAAEGNAPTGPVIMDSVGNLYGTTLSGTVFKLDTASHLTVLHSFPTGNLVDCRLATDPAGNLYGMSATLGTHQRGLIFKVDLAGNETDLYSFTGGLDGGFPAEGLIRDAAGNLWGIAQYGGKFGYGTIFKFLP